MRGGFICKLFLAVLHQKCTVPENIDTYPMEILKAGDGGWGVSKAKICKGKYEAKLEFPKGGGGDGRDGYFLVRNSANLRTT